MLTEDNRKKLDNIVSQMVINQETDDDIQFVVNDFKSKYDAPKKQGSVLNNTIQKLGGGNVVPTQGGFKGFVQDVVQSTVGSKSALGFGQQAGKTLMLPKTLGDIESVGSQYQARTDIANSANNIIELAKKEKDPARKKKLLAQANEMLRSGEAIGEQADIDLQKVEQNVPTVGKVIGTGINFATTALSGANFLKQPISSLLGKSGANMTLKTATNLGKLAGVAENSILGASFTLADNLIEGEKPMKGVGTGALLGVIIPEATKVALKAISGTPKFLQNTASKMYAKILKPSTTLSQIERDAMVQTGLKEGITLSEAGIEKVTNRINNFEEQLGTAINNAASKDGKIKTSDLKIFVEETKKWFQNISDVKYSKNAIKDIEAVYNNFVKKYGKYIPVDEAQKVKTATYRWLKNAYNELASPVKEANKQLVRGLKEGIVDIAPQVGDINKRLKALYAFDEALEKTANRMKNKNLLGLGDIIGLSAGNKVGVMIAILRRIMDGTSGSVIAIQMNRIGKILESMNPMQRLDAFVKEPSLRVIYERFKGGNSSFNVTDDIQLSNPSKKVINYIKENPPGLTIKDVSKKSSPVVGKTAVGQSSLIQEAKKYKSAEEFVKAQGDDYVKSTKEYKDWAKGSKNIIEAYHGTPYSFDKFEIGKKQAGAYELDGISFATRKELAEPFSRQYPDWYYDKKKIIDKKYDGIGDIKDKLAKVERQKKIRSVEKIKEEGKELQDKLQKEWKDKKDWLFNNNFEKFKGQNTYSFSRLKELESELKRARNVEDIKITQAEKNKLKKYEKELENLDNEVQGNIYKVYIKGKNIVDEIGEEIGFSSTRNDIVANLDGDILRIKDADTGQYIGEEIIVNDPSQIFIVNSPKTKSQLTDIWNKANK